MQDELLYQRIAAGIEFQIFKEVLRVGDKLPSIRTVCREQGVSMSTATQAYFELERKGLIESRPKSGYYVSQLSHKSLESPFTSHPTSETSNNYIDDLVLRVNDSLCDNKLTQFSLSVPSDELLPIAKLNKAVLHAMRNLPYSGTGYELAQGNLDLRRQIARWSFTWGGKLREEDIVITAGCRNALALSLMAVTKCGDSIAVESPVYFGILQLAKSLGLNIVELSTNSKTGIEIEALKKVMPQIKACLLVSNFNNPLGSCMPDEQKKEVVSLLSKHEIPLLEDDLYADTYFGNSRPLSCKSFDEEGNVLWCSSVSKTLAPGYRVGWVAAGKYTEQVKRLSLLHSGSASTLTQQVVADFLENGRYENHLRRLRGILHTNSLQFLRAIGEYFPEDTRVTKPQGGFVLWLELNKKIDAIRLYEKAHRQRISIAPGPMFTLQNQYSNCIRLSYGLKWSRELETGLKQLGRMAKEMTNE
ncbi:PLP-dependent aminotransferase family protein [Flavisolibacter tropicus]|uniref:GntR family transcriptional regulator n=1 Tax=Flavisolibacter tropicus TaxID=1492898 RepID=A0A172TS25_9BACT|nr:PLP-dependent aminotransferase family protein [Flavisolibacter tropicus]ANE49885.1 GntR family transcriptional regulator [Flavisolibacter tropicus]